MTRINGWSKHEAEHRYVAGKMNAEGGPSGSIELQNSESMRVALDGER